MTSEILTLAAFGVSVIAIVISAVAAFYARSQARHSRRSADAQEAALRLEADAQIFVRSGPGYNRTLSLPEYWVSNLGRAAAHNIYLTVEVPGKFDRLRVFIGSLAPGSEMELIPDYRQFPTVQQLEDWRAEGIEVLVKIEWIAIDGTARTVSRELGR